MLVSLIRRAGNVDKNHEFDFKSFDVCCLRHSTFGTGWHGLYETEGVQAVVQNIR